VADAGWHGEAMHTVTIEEAAAHLPELIDEACRGGEVVITRGAQPVAKLAAAGGTPPVATGRWAAFGLLKGGIEYASDFDEPIEDFRPYME